MSRISKNLQINMAFYTSAFFGLAVGLGLYLMLCGDGKDFRYTAWLFTG